jgi:GNAT superfamily N-acetyltransferase
VIRELSRTDFRAELETLLAIYTAAMRPEPGHLPGRLSIMDRHAGHPGFRAVVAQAVVAPAVVAPAVVAPAVVAPAVVAPAVVTPTPPGRRIVAFAYGFRGAPGQWWHDVVRTGVEAASGYPAAVGWLADPLEIAEVHVRPDYQHQGIGRRILYALTAGRTERTAVLSTKDCDSAARRLYRSLGFTDLLTGFAFPGGGPPYAVMGAVLPLRETGPWG